MDSELLLVAQSGSVDALYSLIQNDPYILNNLDVLPFIHTPLHEASSIGKIDMAMELMTLKPSFATKLNVDGFSPLHLAVENHHVELALELVKFDPSLVRVRGRGGMTPLHRVVQIGDVDLLTEFLMVCPESLRDANANGETAIHLSVMNEKYEELKVLGGWMQRMRKRDASSTEVHVMNRRDREGNTALHVAAHKNNHQAVKQLLKCMSLNRNIQNKKGMTALDVLRANGADMNIETVKAIQKAGGKSANSLSKVKPTSVFLRKPVTFWEYCSTRMARYRSRMSDGTRNALLVITTLIITATYQTVAQPQDKHNLEHLDYVEEIILEMVLIWGFNTIAFFSAIALTFILLPVGRAYTWWYILISGPLVCSYAISLYVKYNLSTVIIDVYSMVLLGFFVYILVFYVKWKRDTQKKVPEPKIELISEV
ncbi:Ankyrin repeat family protein [Raphanus sativus]|uniref:Ankyrin repeat-containing protein BDA1-like n=1 Tax=Raphanus sativus TaxID=3726 RepID=A0A6J0L593_RAPSA|nr:ankyrin repeat-containing protein BDA1-like [Raphanus sativus]KAJ4875587.1 Ankyrin repeat family protein [Raphanus sativus]